MIIQGFIYLFIFSHGYSTTLPVAQPTESTERVTDECSLEGARTKVTVGHFKVLSWH
jgi:hypothetical protein